MTSRRPRKRQKIHVITDEDQAEAIASPVRMEVMEHLCIVGPASVRDVAERMGRTPHAVHYHVRCLVETGLVVETGTRKSGPRDQTLYDVIAENFTVDMGGRRGQAGCLESKAMRSVLRRAERDFSALATSAPERLSGDEVFAGRLRARLSVRARKDVMKHLHAIQRLFAEEFRREHPPQARVEAYSMTVVLLPEAAES